MVLSGEGGTSGDSHNGLEGIYILRNRVYAELSAVPGPSLRMRRPGWLQVAAGGTLQLSFPHGPRWLLASSLQPRVTVRLAD